MKAKKWIFSGLLALATLLIVGCGDEEEFSEADKQCVKMLKYGQQCAPIGSGSTTTATVTQTSTVTVTNSNSSN